MRWLYSYLFFIILLAFVACSEPEVISTVIEDETPISKPQETVLVSYHYDREQTNTMPNSQGYPVDIKFIVPDSVKVRLDPVSRPRAYVSLKTGSFRGKLGLLKEGDPVHFTWDYLREQLTETYRRKYASYTILFKSDSLSIGNHPAIVQVGMYKDEGKTVSHKIVQVHVGIGLEYDLFEGIGMFVELFSALNDSTQFTNTNFTPLEQVFLDSLELEM